MTDRKQSNGKNASGNDGQKDGKTGGGAAKPKMFEQDANDIQDKPQHSQVPDVNPPSVQPGHRDREQI